MMVMSATGKRIYETDVLDGCTCPAKRFRPHRMCKHQAALSEYNRKEAQEGRTP